MIISKTPFRISFVGGGSDLRVYYLNELGAVVSTAIDKYMYVNVNKRFEESVRVSYTITEIAKSLEDIKHDLVRESLRLSGLFKNMEVTTIGDVPAGTGLGSSSSLTVGLLNALYKFAGKNYSQKQLAEDACKIEMDILKKPMGKQDQYSAAFGDLSYIQFNPDETVDIEPIRCSKDTKQTLNKNLLMFYSGIRGKNNELLAKQIKATEDEEEKKQALNKMVLLAQEMKDCLKKDDLTSFGELLHQNWLLKKSLTQEISNKEIDDLYKAARNAGALGGKILGAGGNGFLLFYCDEEKQSNLRKKMLDLDLREFEFNLDSKGSRIIYPR